MNEGALMRRHINLSELSHIPTPKSDTYSPDLMERARAAQVQKDLRWDNVLGVLRDNDIGLRARFVNQSDHEPHENEEDVMQWVFASSIKNSASRISRGFEP
jgi:hypothetical protein